MRVTKDILANKILEFLNRRISIDQFANWAENAMIEGDYEEEYFDVISDLLPKIGVVNVKGFELPIAFYLNALIQLKFHAVFGLCPSVEQKQEFVYV